MTPYMVRGTMYGVMDGPVGQTLGGTIYGVTGSTSQQER